MRKPLWTLLLIVATVMSSLLMIAWSPAEKQTEARIVYVQRGDVHQVVAITGKLGYTEEMYAAAPVNCSVARICTAPGQRVAAGEALIRFNTSTQEDAAAAMYSGLHDVMDLPSERFSGNTGMSVLRAEEPATTRQIYVQEGAWVTAGTPLIRLTSGEQEITCAVPTTDADEIVPGMWSWIYHDGESIGFAQVTETGETAADPTSGLTYIPVKLRPTQHLDLPEGTTIDAEIFLAGSDDVETLPVEAITERGTVWWISDGRCTEIPANVVLADEILAWVMLPEGLPVAVGEYEEGVRIREADE